MKHALLILLLFYCICTTAQPQAINYQGVARDSIGHVLINQNIGINLSILESSNSGQIVYAESHSVSTNASGLFMILLL